MFFYGEGAGTADEMAPRRQTPARQAFSPRNATCALPWRNVRKRLDCRWELR